MKAVIFSGTGDGKEICRYLSGKGIETTACVATEYGREVMEEMPFVSIHEGRMNEKEIEEFIKGADFIIDATHPYAQEITGNIKNACRNAEIEYIRMKREENENAEGIFVKDIKEAVKYLKGKRGNIFVSTGSKEIEGFREIENYRERIYARVLDREEIREKCQRLGFKNVMYKMPPYTEDENMRDFKGCKYLVTKSSGKTGGFDEKISAAEKLGMEIIIIKRPKDYDGFSKEEVKRRIDEKCSRLKFPLFIDLEGKKVTVIGAGEVGCRRIKTLIIFGACVTVISKEIKEKNLIDRVKYIEKEFEESDINRDCFMVIGATDKREINHRIYKRCEEMGILRSIADCKEECSFYFPAVCTGENLSIGIVSDGSDHRRVKIMAEKIRGMIEE